MPKVVMIIASQRFRDEELLKPKRVLEEQGVKVTIASSSLETAVGVLGAKVKPDILLRDVKVEDYDAVIFVGGTGAQEYWNDSLAHSIARKAGESKKLLGAICIAPVTLANAGLLAGRKATVFSSEVSKIKAKGANYTGTGVEIDGRIITADGPGSAEKFGAAIANALK
ncbi:MAG: DJ-1/PfpI family protein [Euryarchaeota archaeon]|nr:DJ-1/PfpI family protein [Euryarchaeota archaeon]